MSKKTVNLDALIPRADLDREMTQSAVDQGDIPVGDLAWNRLHQRLLRKPDFQRETDDWDIENVVAFIKSVTEGHLIPALIMWQGAKSFRFVIDGAHRLSVLLAWVNDDYGDGDVSRKFFGGKIPQKQDLIGKACREQVRVQVGTYAELSNIDSATAPPERAGIPANLARLLKTQWVTGNSDVAQASFFAINQRSVAINETEQYLIKARKKANVIAARAILRSATGHVYWSAFGEKRAEIEAKAKAIYDVLFQPDSFAKGQQYLPIAGEAQSANALRIVTDLIAVTSGRSDKEWADVDDDADGIGTSRVLEKTLAIVKRIGGDNPASLGLHPYVYFWGASGNHSPSAFLAVVRFVQWMAQEEDRFVTFTNYRARFEEILSRNSDALKHISRSQGGWTKSVSKIMALYQDVLARLERGESNPDIDAYLASTVPQTQRITTEPESSISISRGTKAALRRRLVIESSARCWVCHARMTVDDASREHVVKAEHGGLGNEDNIEHSHRYCNSGFRPYCEHRGLPLPANPFPA